MTAHAGTDVHGRCTHRCTHGRRKAADLQAALKPARPIRKLRDGVSPLKGTTVFAFGARLARVPARR